MVGDGGARVTETALGADPRAVALELSRLKADPWYFMTTYARIPDPLSGETIAWEPWSHLEALLDLWRRERQCVVLKARQLGITWLMAGYALWRTMLFPNAQVLILSKGQSEANDALSKARFIHRNLPQNLAWEWPALGMDNTTELEFGKRNSRIRALPSSPSAGRSATASLVILDEFAHHDHASEVYAAVKPTIDAGGQMLAVSTASGLGNTFHALWQGAGGAHAPAGRAAWIGPRGANGFVPAFLPWSARPGRDEAWFAQVTAEYPPHLREQEYPSDAYEAFIVSGRPVFDKAYLDLDPALVPLERGDLLPDVGASLTVFRIPHPGRRYILGADVAQGLLHGGASCVIVLDEDDGAEVAHLHERVPPDVFAGHLHVLASAYPGLVGVERNNHGHVVLSKLRELLARGTAPYVLYRELRVLTEPIDSIQPSSLGQIGWNTTRNTKQDMIADLEEALRKRWIRLATPALRMELLHYQRGDDGDTGAPSGECDDRVMALAIAWQMRAFRFQKATLERVLRPRVLRVSGLW